MSRAKKKKDKKDLEVGGQDYIDLFESIRELLDYSANNWRIFRCGCCNTKYDCMT